MFQSCQYFNKKPLSRWSDCAIKKKILLIFLGANPIAEKTPSVHHLIGAHITVRNLTETKRRADLYLTVSGPSKNFGHSFDITFSPAE
jgi:hypothetical protein